MMPQDKKFAYLPDGGVTGKRVRSMDWSQHPLGPPEHWPTTLKTTLGMLFGAQSLMLLGWGPEMYQFYNDAYLPSFGVGKHPAAMGQRFADCWPEIWPIVGPQIRAAGCALSMIIAPEVVALADSYRID